MPRGRDWEQRARDHANALFSSGERQLLWKYDATTRQQVYRHIHGMNQAEVNRLMRMATWDDWADAARDEDHQYADQSENPFGYH